MERIKRRKLKFSCLFGGNEKTVQTCSTSNATTNHSLFKFHVGKITSKRSNQNKIRSSSIFAKLMGKDVISSTRHINKKQRIKLEKNTVSESEISPNKIILLRPNTSESFSSESEVITFGLNDRLTHSLSSMSESSLINEAKNKMEQKWKTNVNKDCTLGEIPPFSEKEIKHVVELDTSTSSSTSVLPSFQDHRMSEPLKRRERLNGIFYHKEDVALKKERSSKRRQLFQRGSIFNIKFGKYLTESQSGQKSTEAHFEDEDLVKYQPLISDDGATKHDSCMEPLTEKSGGKTPFQLSESETEYCESLKKVDHDNQVSDLYVPPIEYASSRFQQFELLDAQLQDLKKQLHLLKIKSLYTSNHPTRTQKRNQHDQQQSSDPSTWESSFSLHILLLSDIYETDPDTIHHPTDPRLFYRIEKYYFEGAMLSKSEKHLLYDYIEQTFIKISKTMAAGPQKQENVLTLSCLSIEDQVFKVVEEIKKEDTESFLVNNYDKDPEWLEENQINNLGNLLSELVLIDLVLEVISFFLGKEGIPPVNMTTESGPAFAHLDYAWPSLIETRWDSNPRPLLKEANVLPVRPSGDGSRGYKLLNI